jgi:hypothetical protein
VNQLSFPFLFRVVEISSSHCFGVFFINGFYATVSGLIQSSVTSFFASG